MQNFQKHNYQMADNINLQWKGQADNSIENCVFTADNSGTQAAAVIAGNYGKLLYLIKTNPNWETVYFEINAHIGDKETRFSFHGDGKGNWRNVDLNGCIDIDISLTPFTNSLPINRLHLKIGERRIVDVLYVDVLERQIKKVQQAYTRISTFKYQYENVPNDFEAVITVDRSGFVMDYPGLFVRTL